LATAVRGYAVSSASGLWRLLGSRASQRPP
jgi:hypothetical protein